jgi:hypothetical protein
VEGYSRVRIYSRQVAFVSKHRDSLILGRAFEQIGQANTETDARRLFQLIGRAMPYLGIAGSSQANAGPLASMERRSSEQANRDSQTDQSS